MCSKRILIYCPVFLPEVSGYTHSFKQLILNLLSHGFEVDVVTPRILNTGVDEPFQHQNLKVFRYNPFLKVWGLGLFYQYYKQASFINKIDKQRGYNLVLIETGDVPLLPYFLPKSILNKTTVRFHSTSDTEYLYLGKHKKYKLRRWFWQYLSGKKIMHVNATNAYHLQYAQNNVLHTTTLKSKHVLINTVDVVPQNTNVKSTPITFVMLGRMDEEGFKQKGFNVLLKALDTVKQYMLNVNAQIHIVGNGSCFAYFKEQVSTYDFVKLTQEMNHEQLLQLLQQSDVVILPSLYEGVSMFALEALATGNAVIFSNTGGLIEMVDGNGVLITPGNANDLALAIIKLLDVEKLESLKKQSLLVAKNKFSSEVQYAQFMEIYREVCS
jgi:glycosyltransferase involved in cell wall biosynthesis